MKRSALSFCVAAALFASMSAHSDPVLIATGSLFGATDLSGLTGVLETGDCREHSRWFGLGRRVGTGDRANIAWR